VRQPLIKMGRMAAQTVLRRISRPAEEANRPWDEIIVEPELIVRGTTAAVRQTRKATGSVLQWG
jgi:DNA-binding LacI/PurR family transcriptional regulator